MNLYKTISQLTLQILFVTIFFSTLHARNLEKFDSGKYISSYFSGILHLNNSDYNESNKFLKKLDGLEKIHFSYTQKYIRSLVNSGKFLEAFFYSKKLEKQNQANFESNLIIGIYHLKNEKYDLAEKYFLKSKKKKSRFILDSFVTNSLLNWSKFHFLCRPKVFCLTQRGRTTVKERRSWNSPPC